MGEFPSKENQVQNGEVLNPKGRGKGTLNRSTIAKRMIEAMAAKNVKDCQKEILGEDHDPKTIADQMAAGLAIKAMAGDTQAFKELMDSAYGKLTEKVDSVHSFSQMGRVTAQTNGAEDDHTAPITKELTFDVGREAPKQLKQEDINHA